MSAATMPRNWRHDPHAQSYRAALHGPRRRAAVRPRDRSIVAQLAAGASQRAVAAAVGVSRSTVRTAAARLRRGSAVPRCAARACGRSATGPCWGRPWVSHAGYRAMTQVEKLRTTWATGRLSLEGGGEDHRIDAPSEARKTERNPEGTDDGPWPGDRWATLMARKVAEIGRSATYGAMMPVTDRASAPRSRRTTHRSGRDGRSQRRDQRE